MPRPKQKPSKCSACPRITTGLRRGLCNACYLRERRGSPAVGLDASCLVCGLADGRILRAVKLDGDLVVACYNHAHLLERARPKPRTVAAFVAMCRAPGDRRRGLDRRTGADRRDESDRREDLDDRRAFGPRAGEGDRRDDGPAGRRTTDSV